MKRFAAIAAVLALAVPLAAVAQEAPAAAERTVRDDYLFVFNGSESKLKSLAGAFSEEQFAWRPAEGVRSVGEAFQHAALAVYYFGRLIGFELPADAPKSREEYAARAQQTSKAEVAAALDSAFAFAHQMIETVTPEQLGREIEWFGNQVNGRTLLLVLADHNAEHLGQLIAYARSNGVVPPWSVEPPSDQED